MGWFLSGGTLRTSSGEIVGTVRSSETDAMMDLLQTGSSVKSSKAEIDPLNARHSSITFDMKESDFTELMRMSESKTLVDGKKRVLVVDSFSGQSVARRMLGMIGAALDAAQKGVSVVIPPERQANFIAAGGGRADILADKERRYAVIKEPHNMKITPALVDSEFVRWARNRPSGATKKREPALEKKARRKAARASRRKNRK